MEVISMVIEKKDIEEMEKSLNEELSELKIHQLLRQLNLIDLFSGFDATRLHLSAMWNEKSIHP